MLTITHLPQIASVADTHYRVTKVPGDPTQTRIEPLDDAQRRDELERMLGGKEFLSTLRREAGSAWNSRLPGRARRRDAASSVEPIAPLSALPASLPRTTGDPSSGRPPEPASMSLIEHTGPARLGRRTKELVRRLGPDDIAVIDHTDLDRVSAEELVESGVRVVVNVAPSQSGRYPNPGPLQLVRGGVRLIDVEGSDLFEESRTASA